MNINEYHVLLQSQAGDGGGFWICLFQHRFLINGTQKWVVYNGKSIYKLMIWVWG